MWADCCECGAHEDIIAGLCRGCRIELGHDKALAQIWMNEQGFIHQTDKEN